MDSGPPAFLRELQRAVDGAREVVFMDFPYHPNVGDSLIFVGARAALQSLGVRICQMCAPHEYDADGVRALSPRSAPILINGGGNFGTLWPHHHALRLRVLRDFPDRRIVQLPQSIHFGGADDVNPTVEAIRRHGHFELMVRDEPSESFARLRFPCPVRLVPDCAFWAPVEAPCAAGGIVGILRSDSEIGDATAATAADRAEQLRKHGIPVTDWLTPSRAEESVMHFDQMRSWRLARWPRLSNLAKGVLWRRMARAAVARGTGLIAQGGVVITDRLHVMILSLMTGRRVVYLENSYGKLGAVRACWFPEAEQVVRATTLDQAVELARSMVRPN